MTKNFRSGGKFLKFSHCVDFQLKKKNSWKQLTLRITEYVHWFHVISEISPHWQIKKCTFTWKIFRENDFLHNNVDFTGKVQSFWNYILPELCFEITRAFSLASSSGMLHFFVVNNWEFWSARLETYLENPRKIVKNQKNIAVR